MRTKGQYSCIVLLLSAVIAGSIFGGCGYSIHRHASLPFTELNIGLVENKTLEPKLQDRLHRALVEEFMKQGVSINPAAGHKLTGVINSFDMVSLSEKKGITAEYRVIINANFTLAGREGGKRDMNISTPFIISFSGSEDMGRLISGRELAEERALRDIAAEVAGMLIYK